MIQRFFSKYGLAVHLALLAALPLALTPFLTAATTLASVILWLSAFGAAWFFAQPDLRRGEHISSSRVRLRRELLVDPVFWFMVLALLYALLRWANTGIVVEYDVEKVQWFVKEPPWPGFPASAKGAGLLPFAVALASALVVLGVRDGLGTKGRVVFGVVGGMVSGLGGLAAAVCACAGEKSFVAASADMGFAAAPFWASSFGVWLVAGLASAAAAEVEKWTHSRIPHILSVSGNIAALMYFAPPLVAAAWGVLALATLIFCCVYVAKNKSLGAMVRYLVLAILAVAVPVFMAMAFMEPRFFIRRRAFIMKAALSFPDAYKSQSEVLSRLARDMWQDRPWFGVGCDAFQFRAPFLAEQEDWAVLPLKPLYATNSYWNLIAERGIGGCLLLVVGFGLLAAAFVLQCVRFFVRFGKSHSVGRAMLAVPPVVWCLPLAIVLIALEGIVSPVFTVGTIILTCVVPLVLSGSSFPNASSSDEISLPEPEPEESKTRHHHHHHHHHSSGDGSSHHHSSHSHESHGSSSHGHSEQGHEHHSSEK